MAHLTGRNQGETCLISSHRTVRRKAYRLRGQKLDLRYPQANYFGVTDNSRALSRFEHAVHRLLFKGLNRRSQRRSFTWERFRQYCRRHTLPRPGRLVRRTPVGSMPI